MPDEQQALTCEFREITPDSPFYAGMLELRRAILRKPLGLDFSALEIEAEIDDQHFILIDQKSEIVGCGVMVRKSSATAKVRQVAIQEKHRGKGLGRSLMTGIENAALNSGYTAIELNARETALTFYQNLDYEVEGDVFLEVGIPHYKMRKPLS